MTRAELRSLVELLDCIAVGDLPALAERALIDMRHSLMRELEAPVVEKGAKVFEWKLPLFHPHVLTKGKNKGKVRKDEMAPTMNKLVAMNTWERAALRERLDHWLKDVIEAWPLAGIQDSQRPRIVRVTRSSHAEPDEMGVDAIGGKVPIDRMVQAGILAGDTRKHLHREAHWTYAPKNEGSVLIEVFEVRGDGAC